MGGGGEEGGDEDRKEGYTGEEEIKEQSQQKELHGFKSTSDSHCWPVLGITWELQKTLMPGTHP